MATRHIRDAVPLIRSFVAYAAIPAAGIITAPILAHALGPIGRGQLAGILQPMTLASAVAALGVPSAVTYFIGRGHRTDKTIEAAIKIALVMTFLVGGFLLLYSAPVADQLKTDRVLILMIWAAFLPSALIAIKRGHIQGLRRYRILDLERIIASGLRVGSILFLWYIGVQSVIFFAAVYMFSGLGASLVLWVPSANEAKETGTEDIETLPNASGAFSKISPTKISFLSYTMFSAFGTIAAAMSARLDQAIMPAVVEANELGYYSVAVTVAEVPTIFTTVLTRNILGDVASGVSNRLVIRAIMLGGLAQAVLIILLLLALPYLVPVVFGQDFGPAMVLIHILLLGSFISYWANVVATYLGGLGKPGYNSLGQAVAALTTILMFWTLWDNTNGVTAAWISVFSQTAALFVSIILIHHVSYKRPEN